MQNVIFYFSGTGNSLQLAQGIAARLENCEALNIAKTTDEVLSGVERIGFVFPVYFGGLPQIAHSFLRHLDIPGDPFLFGVANCGGTSGVFLKQICSYLGQKGKTLHSGYSVLMPENFILMYNRFSPEREKVLFSRAEEKIEEISLAAQQKQHAPFEHVGNSLFRYFAEPFNRTFVAHAAEKDCHFHVSDRCIGCGKCQRICSVGNVILRGQRPVWNRRCQLCMGCINVCPVKAIEYGRLTQKRERYLNPNMIIS